jgi:hypothetical protein
MELPENRSTKSEFSFRLDIQTTREHVRGVRATFDFTDRSVEIDGGSRKIWFSALPLLDYFNIPGPDTDKVLVYKSWSGSVTWARRFCNRCEFTGSRSGFGDPVVIRHWFMTPSVLCVIKEMLAEMAPEVFGQIQNLPFVPPVTP